MNNEKIAAKHDRLQEIDRLLPALATEINDARDEANKRVEVLLEAKRKQIEAQFQLTHQKVLHDAQQELIASHGEKLSQLNTLREERQGIVSALQFVAELLDDSKIAAKALEAAP